LTGIFGFALVFMMILAACDNGSTDSGTSDSGTLVLHNSSTIDNRSILKVKIWEGTEPAEGAIPKEYTTPIAIGASNEWSLSAGAYCIKIEDNTEASFQKSVSIKAGETTNVNYTGNGLN
jgi:hypothetical protein